MKRLFLLFLLFAQPSFAAETPASFADLVEKLSPAVVNISTTELIKGQTPPVGAPVGQPGKPMKAVSLGSGFIISADGIIVTNNHVIAGGTDITVTLHNDTKLKAKLIGRDTKIDVAVLKVDAGKPLTAVKFGNSDAARVGDWVLAIGNPYGLGGTVTAGIISAKARDLTVGPFDDFLQTDAAINRGNSGGPMFNVAGDVVGINTAIFTPGGSTGGNVGIGFATPASLAKPVIEQIIKYGRAKRAWLGVKIQTVTDEIANSIGLKTVGGALVQQAVTGSPAAKAGIKEGDVITKFAGQALGTMRKLPRIVADTELGSNVPVEIYRNGKTIVVNVTLTEMTAEQEKAENANTENLLDKTTALTGRVILGMKLAEITPAIKDRYKLVQDKGLLIAEVAADSNASTNNIRGGSVITKADQKPVVTLNDLATVIEETKRKKRDAVLLLVQSANGAEERFVPVNLK